MKGLVREAIGEPKSVASQKLTDEGHSNLLIQPSIYRTSTMCQAPRWVLKIHLQKKKIIIRIPALIELYSGRGRSGTGK